MINFGYLPNAQCFALNRLISETTAGLINMATALEFNPGQPLAIWFNRQIVTEVLKSLADDYVDNFSVYAADYFQGKEKVISAHQKLDEKISVLFPETALVSETQKNLIRDQLSYVLSDAIDQIYGFVLSTLLVPTWHVWEVRLIGTTLILSCGMDYRVLEYYRLTGQPVPLE